MEKSRAVRRAAKKPGHGWVLAVLLLALVGLGTPGARAARLNDVATTTTWITDGPVYAIARTSSTVYLGGSFSRVGPAMGDFAILSAATGEPTTFPKVNGIVLACVPDGAGGWYIGGVFTRVGALARSSLAHILADGSVDPAWNPVVQGGVSALAVSSGLVYAGGSFTSIGGQTRNRLASLDAVNGAVTSWNPNVSGSTSSVDTLAILGGTVYVGGDFSSVGGQTRNNAAAVDATSGAVTPWNPNPKDGQYSNSVYAIVAYGGVIYAAGNFYNIGGQQRTGLAALDPSIGLATAWDPKIADGGNGVQVYALAVSGGTVYFGGTFLGSARVGKENRNCLAAVDATSGTVRSNWHPEPNYTVLSLAVSGGTIYVGGNFSTIGGQARSGLAALDAVTGAAKDWQPKAGRSVYALAVSGAMVAVGTSFQMVGGQSRNRLAALDAATGALTPWNPSADNTVYALALAGGAVYAGGAFTSVGGQTRNHMAAIDAASGAVMACNPDFNRDLYALAAANGKVYAGGGFTKAGGQARNYLAAFDAASGVVTPWNPNVNNDVSALAVVGRTVYAGGYFSMVGGQRRYYLAALDAISGTMTAWNPNTYNSVQSLAVAGRTVFAGGDYTAITNPTPLYLRALDAISGTATAWNPNPVAAGIPNPAIRALAISGGTIYAGGEFTSIGGQKRNFLAALDATSGAASSWNPSINRIINYGFDPSSIKALSVSGGTVYVGGSFDRIGEEFQSNFARFDTTSTLVTPIRPRATEIQPDRLTWTWDDTTDAKIGFKVWADPGANAAATLCTTTTATSWVYSGLTPNVPYTFQVTAFSASDESVCTDAYTTFTLAAAPTDGQNVTGTQMTETPRPLGASFLFTNPLGFGPGSHGGGIYAVSAFRWVWDENPTCAFGGGESVWAIDELVCTPTRAGRYYLHLQSLNAAGVATPQTLDLGPFVVTMTNGLRNWQTYR